METDALIQRALRAACIQNGTTLLTIAHRLNTIIDYDKVLVMSFGKVVEFDSPANLLRDEKSHFSLMLAETGAENSAALRLQAFQAESLKCAPSE
jgi:ABC-type multidrug transport system fused ATPase/permease subunit